MNMIASLRDDLESQKILADPAVMAAIMSGTIASLEDDPRIVRLLENKTVRYIMNKVAP